MQGGDAGQSDGKIVAMRGELITVKENGLRLMRIHSCEYERSVGVACGGVGAHMSFAASLAGTLCGPLSAEYRLAPYPEWEASRVPLLSPASRPSSSSLH
jgi:hypothetical protein